MNHEKWRIPEAPGQQREGPSPRGMPRREPERLGWRRAENRRSWGGCPAPATESSSAGSQREAGIARVAVSDGLIITHVPDLSSLSLLMQQCETGQVF